MSCGASSGAWEGTAGPTRGGGWMPKMNPWGGSSGFPKTCKPHARLRGHCRFALRDQVVQRLCAILDRDAAPKRFYFALLRKVLLWEGQNPIVLKNPPCMFLHQASQLQGCLEDPMANKVQNHHPEHQSHLPEDELSLMRIILVSAMAAAAINAAF